MSLRHTLLALLDWVPMHGYALRETARGFAWLHPMTNANIYPTLRQMEEEGLIEHREEVVDGRLRKIYRTTGAGQAELGRWLEDAATPDGVYRDPRLLKISLLRGDTLRSASKWIRDDLDRIERSVAGTEAFLAERESLIPKYTMAVARHGLDLARLRARFLREILEEIGSDLAD